MAEAGLLGGHAQLTATRARRANDGWFELVGLPVTPSSSGGWSGQWMVLMENGRDYYHRRRGPRRHSEGAAHALAPGPGQAAARPARGRTNRARARG